MGYHDKHYSPWWNATIGAAAVVWLGYALAIRPAPFDVRWAVLLLLLAVLVLVPLGLSLLEPHARLQALVRRLALSVQLPAALLLVAAFSIGAGTTAALLALPWLAVTLLLAVFGLLRIGQKQSRRPGQILVGAGLVFPVIGSVWTVLYCLGRWPLGFEPAIVLLTGIHFHYAGFVLPVTAGVAHDSASRRRKPTGTHEKAYAYRSSDAHPQAYACGSPDAPPQAYACGSPVGRFVAWLCCVAIVGGVPLLATGITATHLGFHPLLESAAAVLMSAGGLLAAALHLRLAVGRDQRVLTRLLWSVAAASLTAAMVLSVLYGLRFYGVLPGLDIPWMRATHGTLNSLGFALPCLLGWRLAGDARR